MNEQRPDSKNQHDVQNHSEHIQFRTVHVIAVTAWVAIVLAVLQIEINGRRLGYLAVSVAAIAPTLVWLNTANCFGFLHTRFWQTLILAVSLEIFVASMFLPVVRVFGPLSGYELFKSSFLAICGEEKSLLMETLFFGFVVSANTWMATVPVFIYWQRNQETLYGHPYMAILHTFGSAIAISPLLFFGHGANLGIGYYLWLSSFIAPVIAVRINIWTAWWLTLVYAGWIISITLDLFSRT